jgi:LDH2 family malate/lactate/ureidoglycolate dehydrogenase
MLIGHEALESLGAAILLKLAVSPRKATLVAESLVASNLRGVDSHGIQLLPYYAQQIEAGNLNLNADGRILTESGACMVYDGENGVGQWIALECCGHAARLAREHGMSLVTARESNHFGAAAYWAQRISASGAIGIVMCNATPLVAPWQGKDARLGTNPICMAVPGAHTWLLDMATTTVAMGKIVKASLSGQPEIPAGWAMDSEGVATTDTATALSGLLMPLGGYKGSGLAMMVEILCAALGGGAMSAQVGGLRSLGPMRVSQCFIGIDVRRFMPLDQFEARMKQLVDMVKSARAAQGYDEVVVAGEPEWRAEEQRKRDGIPVSEGTWAALTEVAGRLGVAIPATH